MAVLIDEYNQNNPKTDKINMKGIFVGNGVMNHETLNFSKYDYMIDRGFVDPEIIPFYRNSCQNDPTSARCKYF